MVPGGGRGGVFAGRRAFAPGRVSNSWRSGASGPITPGPSPTRPGRKGATGPARLSGRLFVVLVAVAGIAAQAEHRLAGPGDASEILNQLELAMRAAIAAITGITEGR